ncbi:FG-GAP-like repeat-containing protein [Intrasporangium sp. YIM S08009]|uniref:FG-GAP-like repeat-containing protein n=1 Tax=Intrasporangium zincisolvens TaxID=3080018 RepID=UPI002B05EC12|nr:FG-GAP-like repeat-containing protein [Intrasporangium sp. YIM S08009]
MADIRHRHLMTLVGAGLAVTLAAAAPPVAHADPPPGGSTTRVSVAQAGRVAWAPSYYADVDRDGRFVAFASRAGNLVPRDSNHTEDVFVRDRATGLTSRVSVSTTGAQANSLATIPSISADGRLVVFSSSAENLVRGDSNGSGDVFVRDRSRGTTTRVSVRTGGGQARWGAWAGIISANGRFVAFDSDSDDLVPGDTNQAGDVFVRDLRAGTTTRVNVSASGGQSPSDDELPDVVTGISGDGRYVTFVSASGDLVPGDTNGTTDVFVRDRVAGTTTRVSVSSTGEEGDRASSGGGLSADGRFIVFDSDATTLDPRDTNRNSDVFVHDRATGVTTGISVVPSTSPDQGPASWSSTISDDGRVVAFVSEGSFEPGGHNPAGTVSVFVHDRVSGGTSLVSLSSLGQPADSGGEAPALSGDGRFVAFNSGEPDLVPGGHAEPDLYVRDRRARPNPFGDFDGDHLSDLIARGSSTGQLLLYRGTGTGLTGRVVIGRSGWNTMNAITRLGDVDGDGREDVVAREAATGSLWLYRGTGHGFLPRVRLGASGWNGLREITAVGDVTGDGRADLVAVEARTGNLYLYPGRGTSLGARRLVGHGGWNGVGELTGVGDFDRDGHNDLVARENRTGALWLYRGTGHGWFASRVRIGAGGWNTLRDLVGVGDFDRDGFTDLVAVDRATRQLYLYVGRGRHLTAPRPFGSGWMATFDPMA